MKFLIRADAPGQAPCYMTGKTGVKWVSFDRKEAYSYSDQTFATIACKALNANKPPCEWANLTYSCEPFDLPAVFLDSEPSSQATMERNPTLPLTINLVSSFGGRQWDAKSNKSALICLGATTPEEALQSALRTAGFVSKQPTLGEAIALIRDVQREDAAMNDTRLDSLSQELSDRINAFLALIPSK